MQHASCHPQARVRSATDDGLEPREALCTAVSRYTSNLLGFPVLSKPLIRETKNSTRKMKKRILAIPIAPAAMPPNPNTAAMTAIMKNTAAQYNMRELLDED